MSEQQQTAGMSKYARKVAARHRAESKAEQTFRALNIIEHPELKPKPKVTTPPPPTRSALNDLGDRPERIARLLEEASDFIASACVLIAECYDLANVGVQRGAVFGIRESMLCAKERVALAAARATIIPNTPQPAKETDNG